MKPLNAGNGVHICLPQCVVVMSNKTREGKVIYKDDIANSESLRDHIQNSSRILDRGVAYLVGPAA